MRDTRLELPRVTHILNLINEEYLLDWSNNLGLNGRVYREVLERYADIGTYTHNIIEMYLTKKDINIEVPRTINKNVSNCVNAFIEWYKKMIGLYTLKILGCEIPLFSEYGFRGTCDLLIKINNKIYLGDFKTSNHISYKYWLQIAAYRKMLREEKGIDVDGVFILRLDKYSGKYEEYILNFSDNVCFNYIDNFCEKTFMHLFDLYYLKKDVEYGAHHLRCENMNKLEYTNFLDPIFFFKDKGVIPNVH